MILDEPTNHLDIYAKYVLLEALLAYTGTVIFVSHDRAFMEALSQKTLALEAGRPHRLYYGGYADYLASLESSKPVEEVSVGPPDAPPGPIHTFFRAAAVDSGETNSARETAKKKAAVVRRLQREEADLIERMDELEAEKRELENLLSTSEVYTSGERTREVKSRLASVTASLDARSLEWERLNAELSLVK